ncbi:MAG: CesT family type III secretion system chaperone [Gammaproteobacteria bacterium]|nr:CesT family type III secretion system chaperone [Gammaproteobacteria bacterium]
MNSQCLQLLSEFCARHGLPTPEPDARDHYQLGFDGVEVSLFEELGKFYVLAEVAPLPAQPEERERLIKKSCSYLFNYLYLDECILNLYSSGEEEHLVLALVLVDTDPSAPDVFEQQLAALVNRAEALTAHLAEAPRPAAPGGGFTIFRP